MKELIVTADDFGLTKGITDGILEAHRHGIVTHASLMAPGIAFDHAVAQARQVKSLGVGVHLTLVEEHPVSDSAEIPSLIDETGRMPRSYRDFLRELVRGHIRLDHIERELHAQVERCYQTGIPITHLDSHQHLHVLPQLLPMVLELAKEYSVPRVRAPIDSPFRSGVSSCDGFVPKAGLSLLGWKAARQIRRSGIQVAHRMVGIYESGKLTQSSLLQMLVRMPDGLTELLCHPGIADRESCSLYSHWGFEWEQELQMLTSSTVRDALRLNSVWLSRP